MSVKTLLQQYNSTTETIASLREELRSVQALRVSIHEELLTTIIEDIQSGKLPFNALRINWELLHRVYD